MNEAKTDNRAGAAAIDDEPGEPAARGAYDYPPAVSMGYAVRNAHRAFQRALEDRIALRGITRGHWYFLRVLWEEDGITQRELSARVGMMEPTTVVALNSMAKARLVRRVRPAEDRRKVHVYLTEKGRRLRDVLLPLAKEVNDIATEGVAPEDLEACRRALDLMTRNLDRNKD